MAEKLWLLLSLSHIDILRRHIGKQWRKPLVSRRREEKDISKIHLIAKKFSFLQGEQIFLQSRCSHAPLGITELLLKSDTA